MELKCEIKIVMHAKLTKMKSFHTIENLIDEFNVILQKDGNDIQTTCKEEPKNDRETSGAQTILQSKRMAKVKKSLLYRKSALRALQKRRAHSSR